MKSSPQNERKRSLQTTKSVGGALLFTGNNPMIYLLAGVNREREHIQMVFFEQGINFCLTSNILKSY